MTDSTSGLDPCVHCGFCLQSCPTYVVTDDEADSPRGSAGVYSVLEPELSRQILSRKLESLEAVDADVIATANPGCIMQIGAGQFASRRGRPVVHPIELLDLSYQRAGYYHGRAVRNAGC